jgi:hypothetical protein
MTKFDVSAIIKLNIKVVKRETVAKFHHANLKFAN